LNNAQKRIETDLYDDIPEQQKRATRNISTWTQEYSLSVVLPWYKKINNIALNQCGMGGVSDNTWIVSAYCIYWTSIYTNTIPSSSQSVKVLCSASLPDITTYIDCVLPESYDLPLAYYAWYLALISVEKNDKAITCLQTYGQTISDIITTNNKRQEYNFINYNN
jgi:hypothetical protein